MSDIEKIKKLRQSTGAGFKDCNSALKVSNGDLDKAIEILRIKGVSKASKKMSRDANEGVIVVSGDTQKTSLKSVSKLAKITKSKVLPCICTYDIKKHKYCFQVFPVLENFPSDNLQDDCARINTVLERQIMINKMQYMWTLRIYKNRPDGRDIYKI